MSIRQPTQTTIRALDFQDNAFSFPVESIVEQQKGHGKLIIKASKGYLLTSTVDTNRKQEQSLEYVLEPEGKWVARDTITLWAEQQPLVYGTVTISNYFGDTSVLSIDGAPAKAEPSQPPKLAVSATALTFDKTPLGEDSYMVLAVSQQHTNVPVMITSNDPERFQIGIPMGLRLAYQPSITFTPTNVDTYVYVRYAPDKAGEHATQLIVKAPYESKIVAVMGRGGRQIPENVRLAFPLVLLLSGLAFIGYTYRCEIAPSLCHSLTPPVTAGSEMMLGDSLYEASSVASYDSLNMDSSIADSTSVSETAIKTNIATETTQDGTLSANEEVTPSNKAEDQTDPVAMEKSASEPSDQPRKALEKSQPPKQRESSSSRSEESELERELNGN